MIFPSNHRLLHAFQGNDQLVHTLSLRFMEHAPMLMTLLEQAWERGDASAVHSVTFRLASHMRVMGLQDAANELALLPGLQGNAALTETKAWESLRVALGIGHGG